MDIMENKIVVQARLILSKKQIYLMLLNSGCNERDANELAEFYFKNPDLASESFSHFSSEFGEEGSSLNDVLTLGLLVVAKLNEKNLDDTDFYNCYLTIKKPVIKNIDLVYEDIDDQYVDSFENLKKRGLTLGR